MEKLKMNALRSFKSELEKYFQDCSQEGFGLMGYPSALEGADVAWLNENLGLAEITGLKRETILNGLFQDAAKTNFAIYLLGSGNIALEVRHLDNGGQTIFMRMAAVYVKKESFQLGRAVGNLFYRGYAVCENDVKFLQALYRSRLSSEEFLNWSRMRFAALVNDGDKFLYALKRQKILFALLSIKLGTPVHFSLPNLLGVAVNAIHHYPDCGDLILRAMEVYGRKKEIHALDMKKGNLAKKISDYILDKPAQDAQFEQVAKIIFPELSIKI